MDTYSIIASAGGYRQAGNFATVRQHTELPMTLMLVKKGGQFRFKTWEDLERDDVPTYHFLTCDGDETAARGNYERISKDHPAVLASLLNLATAMRGISLKDDTTPLQYFKRILWDQTMAQDRFFGYADPELKAAVQAAANQGHFAPEERCNEFHPGATCSYKQTDYDVANVQLTFHENDAALIGGINCIKVEPDIDYYKDLIAHGLGEVVPNKIHHQLTNPVVVYSLRANAQGEEFDPPYIVA